MIDTLKDIVVAFVVGMIGLIVCLIGSIILCIPIAAIYLGLAWCFSEVTGVSPEVGRAWVSGIIAVVAITVMVYREKKETDRWIQSILDGADRAVIQSILDGADRAVERAEADGPAGADITSEQMEQAITELALDDGVEHLLTIPGIWEGIAEYYNNDAIRRIEETGETKNTEETKAETDDV